jgi:hypothetical protein
MRVSAYQKGPGTVSFRGFWGIICSGITNSSENNNRRIPPPPRPSPFFLFTAEEHLAASPDDVTAWISYAQMVKRPLEDEAVVARLQPGVSAPSDVCVSRESIFRARRVLHRAIAAEHQQQQRQQRQQQQQRRYQPQQQQPPPPAAAAAPCSPSSSSSSSQQEKHVQWQQQQLQRQRRGLSLSGEFGAPQTRDNHGKLMQALGLLELTHGNEMYGSSLLEFCVHEQRALRPVLLWHRVQEARRRWGCTS